MRRHIVLCVSILTFVAAAGLAAQEPQPELDAAKRVAILDALAAELNRGYVFPDVAARMEADLRARAGRGEYDGMHTRASFAEALTSHLQAVSRDKHLRVRTGGAGRGAGPGRAGGPPDPTRAFGRAERLEGDVALIEILSFGYPAEAVADVVREVMSEAADARALILDVRANGGGSPHMVALVSSYLFGEKRVHLNSLYFRPDDRTEDFFTDPAVAGEKFGPDKPVFVLTSGRTFSAAEEFTYNLQTRGRATIVGATTGGGANPGGVVALPHGLSMFVPTGRAINPITKTNWEGVGVKPDVAVSADAALETAHRLARDALAARARRDQ